MGTETTLYPFQREGVERMKALGGRVLLADSPGLGKGPQCLFYAKEERCRPTIVVCPASLKWHWQTEAARHVGLRAEVLEGRTPPKRGLGALPPLIILNYDILSGWVELLRELEPSLVILDECQATQSRKSQRTKAAKYLCHKVERVIAASGTPMMNRPADLFPTLNILRPDLFPSWNAYAQTHCNPKRGRFGWDYSGASRLEELNAKIAPFMIRRRKEEVLEDLPAKIRGVIPLDIEDRNQYVQARDDFRRWLKKNPVLNSTNRVEASTQLGHLKRLAARLKLKAVFGFVDDFLARGQKLVLFAIHKSIVKALKDRYGLRCVVVNGDVVGVNRQRAVDRFKHDRKCVLFVGNIRAACAGWSCNVTSHVAFAEIEWVPALHAQAEDRVRGIGRGTGGTCYAHYLVARGTIEERLCAMIQKKQTDVIDVAIDGGEVHETLDLYDELLRELRR